MMSVMCDKCKDPGACCREIRLSFKVQTKTKLETLAWLAWCTPIEGELGLPFIPERLVRMKCWGEKDEIKDEECPLLEEWIYSCPNLSERGRCDVYEYRPYLCASYVPGIDSSCVHHYQYTGCG